MPQLYSSSCMFRWVMHFVAVFFIGIAVANAQTNAQMLMALASSAEQSKALPKPVLLEMLAEGVNLEQAAQISVSASDTAEYAEAYTYYAICMSVSDQQAEAVHDIVIRAAKQSLRPNVVVEAKYTLDHFIENRCDGIERATRGAPKNNLSTENTAATRASISR